MPELPEVETIKRQLAKEIQGKVIKKVEVRLPRLVKVPVNQFKKIVQGAKIEKVNRRAKLILITLNNGWSLVIHLKLTGQLIYFSNLEQAEIHKHTHLIYFFNDGSVLLHNDLRQFGYVKLIKTEKLKELLEKEENYGPEPLEKKFTLKKFKELLTQRPQAKIKPLLMDQTFLAGIGNVYSDEILFYAKVRPDRKVKDLQPEEVNRIYQGIKKILPLAIKYQGTSADQYVDTRGQPGKYIQFLKVYRKENQPCPQCGTKIKRIRLGGRSAHFCPKCQK